MSIYPRSACIALPVLAALSTLWGTGCASAPLTPEAEIRQQLEVISDRVDASVTDPARAEQVRAVVDEVLHAIDDFAAELEAIQKRGAKLNQDYDATRAQFDAMIDEAQADRRKHEERFIDLVMQARKATTAEEWGALFDTASEKPHGTTPEK